MQQKKSFLESIHFILENLDVNIADCWTDIKDLKRIVMDQELDWEEDESEKAKDPVILFRGSQPLDISELISLIEGMPEYITVKDMVDAGIYGSKTNLNDKFRKGLIPSGVYVDIGGRRYLKRDKVLEYIDEFYS